MVKDITQDTPRLIDEVRGVRYGEIIAVFAQTGTSKPRCSAPSS